MQSAFAGKKKPPPKQNPISRKPRYALGDSTLLAMSPSDRQPRDQHQSMLSTLLPTVINHSLQDTPMVLLSPNDIQLVQQHAKQQSIEMSEPSGWSQNEEDPVPSSSNMQSSFHANKHGNLHTDFSNLDPRQGNGAGVFGGLNNSHDIMTESQKDLLVKKRDARRNFLPAIYNSANTSISPVRNRRYKDQQHDLRTVLQSSIMAEVQTLNSTTNPHTISVENQQTKHQQSTQMQTTQLDQDSILSQEIGQGSIAQKADNFSPDLHKQSHEVGGNLQNQNSYMLGQSNRFDMNNVSQDYHTNAAAMTERQLQQMQLVEAAMSTEVQDWTTEEIQDSSYRYNQNTNSKLGGQANNAFSPSAKKNNNQRIATDQHHVIASGRQKFRLNQSSTVMDAVVSAELSSSRRKQQTSSRNSVQKKYQSSDIFALKQINAQQSRLDLLKKIGVTSAQQVSKRKERLLVQSVDLGNYADNSTAKKMFGATARNQNRRLAASPSPLIQSLDFANRTAKKQTFNHASSTGSALKNSKSKQKHFMIAPIVQPGQQIKDLGETRNGDFVTQTLIGQMPTGSRQIPNEIQRTFDPSRKNTTNKNIDLKSQTSMPEYTVLQKQQVTGSFKFSDYASNTNHNLESPMLRHQDTDQINHKSSILSRKNQLLEQQNRTPLKLEKLIKNMPDSMGVNNDSAYALATIPPTTGVQKKITEDLSPLLALGYTTLQQAQGPSHNVSQSILMNKSPHQIYDGPMTNDNLGTRSNYYDHQRVTTGKDDGADSVSFGGQVRNGGKQNSKDDVTSELYSQREIEVLRAKIEKRITLQQRMEQESDVKRQIYEAESVKKTRGPQRLNMETQSRKTVMKILQDNKQKLRQTRQQMIEDIRNERKQDQSFSRNNDQNVFNSSINLSTSSKNPMNILQEALHSNTASSSKFKPKSRHTSNDPVLQNQVYGRMTSGMPGLPPKDDMISQMDKIMDTQSQDQYHQRMERKRALKKKKDSVVSQSVNVPSGRYNIIASEASLAMPSYITDTEKSQADRDREAQSRLWLYQIDQVEQESLCLDKDREFLHGMLKYKMSHYIKTKPKETELYSMYHYEQKKVELTSEQKEAALQRQYHALAQSFKHQDSGSKSQERASGFLSHLAPKQGRLMTRKSMENLLEKLNQEKRNMVAANKPIFGEISYDRAVNELFADRAQAALNGSFNGSDSSEYNETSAKSGEQDQTPQDDQKVVDSKTQEVTTIEIVPQSLVPAQVDEQDLQLKKGMALLLRHEPNKTSDKQSDEELQGQIQAFVKKLFSNMPSIESDYLTYYDATRETPELSHTFDHKQTSSPQIKKRPTMLKIPNQLDLQKMHSAAPGIFQSQTFSPLKHNRLTRKTSLLQIAVDGSAARNTKRKITIGGLIKMQQIRDNKLEMQRFPLKYLTEDTTEEFNLNSIATKIYELIHFYKVNKKSLSQVFLEKKAQDHRLGYLLECMDKTDVILPILNQVQPDGTLYLKEYLMNSGHAHGLSVACQMNDDIFQKVFIDNCSLKEQDTAQLINGFAVLMQLRSLVFRRTAIGCDSIPFLAEAFVKMFPSNLGTLKIEKCQISKEATYDLVVAIKEKCYLRTLSLVAVSFDAESIEVLCEYLSKKSYIEELDLSDNHLEPKLFIPLLEALAKCKQLKHLNIAWNLLLENFKPPQIGTYIKEEKLIFGRADEPIEFPEEALQPTAIDNNAATGGSMDPQQDETIDMDGDPGEKSQNNNIVPPLNLTGQNFNNPATMLSPNNQAMLTNLNKQSTFQMISPGDAQLKAAALTTGYSNTSGEKFISPKVHETTFLSGSAVQNIQQKQKKPKIRVQEDLSEQETIVLSHLQKICKFQQIMHLDVSDCGLTEAILLQLSKTMNKSVTLLSVHLSGNPGLKDHVIRKIQGKLKATYEAPCLKQTFKPLIRQYNNKHGISDDPKLGGAKVQNRRDSILAGIEERDSLSSGSLYDYSEKDKEDPVRLKEQITYKNLMREKEALTAIDDCKMSRDMQRHFMVQRNLGNDLIMPGQSDWQISRESSQECWVCDRKQFVFFFWSPEFGELDRDKVAWLTSDDKAKIMESVFMDRDTNNLREARRMKISEELHTPRNKQKYDVATNKIKEVDSDEISESIKSSATDIENLDSDSSSYLEEDDSDSIHYEKPKKAPKSKLSGSLKLTNKLGHLYNGPTICGSWNNWQPQPLIKVQNLAKVLDVRPKPDFLKEIREMKKCRAGVKVVSDMTPRERVLYEEHVSAYENSYGDCEVWGPIIAKMLNAKYKQTRIVGRECFEELFPKQIYVAGAFMNLGKHNYIVKTGSKTYFHETKVSFRRENIPVFIKPRKNINVIERNADVFKLWMKDTPEIVAKVYDLDFANSKCGQIIKSVGQQEDIREFMLQHYDWMKDLFLTLSINSGNFPYLNSQDFARFCRDTKINDKKIDQSRIDTIVSYVKSKPRTLELQKLPQQGALDLSRAEFLEAIIRIAIAKFKDHAPNPTLVTIQDAIERMVLERLRPNCTTAPWQIFRDEELWTREVNLVFFDNQEGLKKLYKSYSKGGKVPYANAIQLLTTDCPIHMDKFDAMYCYGMSLSTCTDLFKLTQNKLLNQSYEEFLEMIARMADLHFQGSDQESAPLWEKIMHILDELFTIVEDCQPTMPKWTEEEEGSDSEPGTPQAGLQKLKQVRSDVFSQDLYNPRTIVKGGGDGDDDEFFYK